MDPNKKLKGFIVRCEVCGNIQEGVPETHTYEEWPEMPCCRVCDNFDSFHIIATPLSAPSPELLRSYKSVRDAYHVEELQPAIAA
jgi:ribosome-binding protein aMBF1 (putative translation factor)